MIKILDNSAMTDEKSNEEKYELLPTGKRHVSFSEVKSWKECPYRHKLQAVMKIDLSKPGPYMDFGTAVHAACENYLSTRVMDTTIATKIIESVWEKNKDIKGFEPETLSEFITQAAASLADIPAWFEETFPGWEYVDAEHELYEQIEAQPHAFKGFIDGVIKVKDKKGKELIWLLDWKSCGARGWDAAKRSDEMVRTQLILYKNFWSKKMNVSPKNVRCAFILLKRIAKPGAHCELIPVSVGDITTGRALKVVNNMLTNVKRGMALKNRNSCKYCDYYQTEHCR